MKYIRYIFGFFVLLGSFLIIVPSVKAKELGVMVDDIYETINGNLDWRDIYVPEIDVNLDEILKDEILHNQLYILQNYVAIYDDLGNVLFDKYVKFLYVDDGPGTGILVFDGVLFYSSIEDLNFAYNNQWTIQFTRRKNDFGYHEGYNDAKNEFGYDDNGTIIPGENAYDLGYSRATQESGELKANIIDFVPGVLGAIFMFFFQLGQIGILGITILDILGIIVLISGLIFLIKFFF